MKVIILAGGSGTRLWPLSRAEFPKQYVKIPGIKNSLFQETLERSLLLADINDIFIVTNKIHKDVITNQIEELGYVISSKNILIEPEAKNTLPAIYAGVHEINIYGRDTIVVFPSDHLIKESNKFIDIIKCSEVLTKDFLITFGIKPDRPNTGFGYISPGEIKENGFIVKDFKEKPNYEKALEYINDGYFWNAGIFLFDSYLFKDEVKKYAIEIYEAFQNGFSIDDAFSKITTKISVDYGIMEKSNKVVVVPANIGWNDLGSFDSIYEINDKDINGNLVSNDGIILNSYNNLIMCNEDKTVAAIDIEDIFVIDNSDSLLICKKGQTQKVKEVVDILNNRMILSNEVFHNFFSWGNKKTLGKEKGSFTINKISIKSGNEVPYQCDNFPQFLFVVKGTMSINNRNIEAGNSFNIKPGQKFTISNKCNNLLEIIEIILG